LHAYLAGLIHDFEFLRLHDLSWGGGLCGHGPSREALRHHRPDESAEHGRAEYQPKGFLMHK
jgi:hypothetical protein